MERPEGQGAVLTPEEVETIEGRFAERVRVGSQPSDPNRPPPPITGRIGRSYNEIYYDRGGQVVVVNGEPRSSIITVPPERPQAAAQPRGAPARAGAQQVQGPVRAGSTIPSFDR